MGAATDEEDDAIVRCQNVRRTYSSSGHGILSGRRTAETRTVVAVDDITLSVQPGEIVGLKGPSGSGKSTLLHLLGALDTPTSGTVQVDGLTTSELSRRERARLRLESIGIVFQQFHLLAALPAISNVALPLVEHGLSKRERRNTASALLHRVGLGQRQSHTPGQLSGGEQQRVAIARALVTDPAVLLADEPTGELDTETGNAVLRLFEDAAADDIAVVIASHDASTLGIADRIIELRDGIRVDT